jgi:hypothetical protein
MSYNQIEKSKPGYKYKFDKLSYLTVFQIQPTTPKLAFAKLPYVQNRLHFDINVVYVIEKRSLLLQVNRATRLKWDICKIDSIRLQTFTHILFLTTSNLWFCEKTFYKTNIL